MQRSAILQLLICFSAIGVLFSHWCTRTMKTYSLLLFHKSDSELIPDCLWIKPWTLVFIQYCLSYSSSDSEYILIILVLYQSKSFRMDATLHILTIQNWFMIGSESIQVIQSWFNNNRHVKINKTNHFSAKLILNGSELVINICGIPVRWSRNVLVDHFTC